MKSFGVCLLLALTLQCFSQEKDTTKKINFSGFADVYYSYDFGNPPSHERPSFLSNHHRCNEFNVNLLMGKMVYETKHYRAHAAIMFGNYAQYNLAKEPGLVKNIYEANIGIKLSAKHNLWLDAGIFPSYIGYETAISSDCWTLTRSLAAENSPYYEAAMKVSYISSNEKFTAAALILNGWQHIYKPAYINKPSFGGFLHYAINDKLSVTYTNFLGSDKPDSLNATRIFHDMYITYNGKKFGILAGFDGGQERRPDGKYNTWYVPTLIARMKLSSSVRLVARAEYYNDKDQVVIYTGTKNGFQTMGSSIGVDYAIVDHVLWRIEMKYYNSVDKIFYDNKAMGYENYCLTTSLAVKF